MTKSTKYTLIILLSLILSLILGACGTPKSEQYAMDEYYSGVMPETDGAREAPTQNKDIVDSAVISSSVPGQQPDRIVIKTADMSLIVIAPDASMARIKQMAEGLGGYVVSSNLNQTVLTNGNNVPHATISVRIPAEKLDEAITKIRAESDQLPLVENVNSQDVTGEYVDLDSRLKNLQNTEEQLNSFLEDTTKTEDTLAVYNELTRVREQIELIQGQMKYYKDSAAMSLINVDLTANEAIQPPIKIGGWELKGTLKDAVQGLIDFLQGLIKFLITLIVEVLPILLILLVIFVLPVYLIIRAIIKRNQRRKVQNTPSYVPKPATVPATVTRIEPPSSSPPDSNPPPIP
jgi:hypothetical protein